MTVRTVLGNTSRRGAFNKVFEKAQEQLQRVFGMEMVELPAKEKVTIAQKRGNSARIFLPLDLPLTACFYSRAEVGSFLSSQVLDCHFYTPACIPFI